MGKKKKKKVYNRNSYNNFKLVEEVKKDEAPPKRDPSQRFEYFTREDWNAQPGYAYRPLHTPVRKLRIIYNLNMDKCSQVTKTCKKIVYGIQRRHLHLGWPDINLNFVVAGDGYIYEGLGWDKKIIRLPHHSVETGNMLCIGCIGRYNRQTVPRRMKKALDEFIRWGVEQGKIVKEIFNGEYWRIKQCCKL